MFIWCHCPFLTAHRLLVAFALQWPWRWLCIPLNIPIPNTPRSAFYMFTLELHKPFVVKNHFVVFFFNICFIEVQLIYNVVLISTVQQSESVVLIYVCRYMCMCIYKIYIYIHICVCIGEGNGTPLQHSCLENPMDRGAWWAAVHGVAKSRTWLSDFPFTFHFHALGKEMATHSSVLAWRIPGESQGEPGGLPSMGSHRVRHDWSDLAAAACVCKLNCSVMSDSLWPYEL